MDELIIANTKGAVQVYVDDVDRLAEERRACFITRGDGQAMAYVEKYQEAVEYQTGAEGEYPHLEAEAAALGVEVSTLAGEIIAMRRAWVKVSSVVEAARAKAKAAIRSRSTSQGWQEALDVFVSELPPPP